mgnify:CR=1 FL=1
MTTIQTTGLTKRFGKDVTAVKNLDLQIEDGEIFGFLGPNGAGKSTTINLLLDFIRPTDGSAEVFGLDITEHSEQIRERTGVLPEGYAVYDHLTGREHVEWAIETKGVDDDPDRVLEEVGLAEAARRTAGGYSKGMSQRLALAIALVGDPDLLILDEPSSGLDPNGIQHMRELLRERAADGTTIFFSSHILGEVEAVSDRVGIMNGGELVAVDTLEGLREGVGGLATVELECASIPDSLTPKSMDGVVNSTVKDRRLRIECDSPREKADVIEYVNSHTDVRDVVSTGTSLEELFNTYTDGGRGGPTERDSAGSGGSQ